MLACTSQTVHATMDTQCCSLLACTAGQGKGDLLEAAKPVVCQVQALHSCVGFQSVAENLKPVTRQVQLCQAYQMAQACDMTNLVVSKPEDLHKGTRRYSARSAGISMHGWEGALLRAVESSPKQDTGLQAFLYAASSKVFCRKSLQEETGSATPVTLAMKFFADKKR